MPREDKAKLLDDAPVGDGQQDPEHLLGEVTGNILEEKNADLQFPISKPKLTFEPLDPCDSKPGYSDVVVFTGIQPPVKKQSSCCAGRWTRVVIAIAILSVVVMLVLGITGVIPLGLHRRPGKINFDPSTDYNVQKQIVDFERLAEQPRKLGQGEDPEANETFDLDKNSGPGQIDPTTGYESSVGSGPCAKHGPGGPGRGWEPGRGRHSGKGPEYWRGRHSGRGPWRERHSGQGPDHGPGPQPGRGPRPWPEVYPEDGPDHVPVPQQPGQGPQQPGQGLQQMGKELERNFQAVKEEAVKQISNLGGQVGQILAAPVMKLCPDGTTNCDNVLQVSPLEPLPAVDAGQAKELVGRALAAIQLPAQN